MSIGYETVTCVECGKEYKQMVIDGHMDHVKLCDHCLTAYATMVTTVALDEKVKDTILG